MSLMLEIDWLTEVIVVSEVERLPFRFDKSFADSRKPCDWKKAVALSLAELTDLPVAKAVWSYYLTVERYPCKACKFACRRDAVSVTLLIGM